MQQQINQLRTLPSQELATLLLRVGLGTLFLIGGISKLSQLLDPAREAAILASYWGTTGYVNQFFIDYLFSSNLLTPWFFLTALSSFELVSGIALIIGLAVRPLSIIYGFLLWSFVVSLPVVTTPGIVLDVKTYTSPAMLVQIRDIALSGMMFVLYNLGSGPFSIDQYRNKQAINSSSANWDNLGLLLRLSVGLALLVAGLFSGYAYIPTFGTTPWILLPVALLLISGVGVRYMGYAVMAIMVWYMIYKLNIDKSFIANLNGFKREVAFLGAGSALALLGGGTLFTYKEFLKSITARKESETAQ